MSFPPSAQRVSQSRYRPKKSVTLKYFNPANYFPKRGFVETPNGPINELFPAASMASIL